MQRHVSAPELKVIRERPKTSGAYQRNALKRTYLTTRSLQDSKEDIDSQYKSDYKGMTFKEVAAGYHAKTATLSCHIKGYK